MRGAGIGAHALRPVEHFTRAASKESGERRISVTALGPCPMDAPFFYPAKGADAVAYRVIQLSFC